MKYAGIVTDPSYFEPYYVKRDRQTVKMKICRDCESVVELGFSYSMGMARGMWSVAPAHVCNERRILANRLGIRL